MYILVGTSLCFVFFFCYGNNFNFVVIGRCSKRASVTYTDEVNGHGLATL